MITTPGLLPSVVTHVFHIKKSKAIFFLRGQRRQKNHTRRKIRRVWFGVVKLCSFSKPCSS